MQRKPAAIIIVSSLVAILGTTATRSATATMARATPECVGEWIICDDDPWQECHTELDADAICATPCPNTSIVWAECDDVDCQPSTGAICYYGIS